MGPPQRGDHPRSLLTWSNEKANGGQPSPRARAIGRGEGRPRSGKHEKDVKRSEGKLSGGAGPSATPEGPRPAKSAHFAPPCVGASCTIVVLRTTSAKGRSPTRGPRQSPTSSRDCRAEAGS